MVEAQPVRSVTASIVIWEWSGELAGLEADTSLLFPDVESCALPRIFSLIERIALLPVHRLLPEDIPGFSQRQAKRMSGLEL